MLQEEVIGDTVGDEEALLEMVRNLSYLSSSKGPAYVQNKTIPQRLTLMVERIARM